MIPYKVQRRFGVLLWIKVKGNKKAIRATNGDGQYSTLVIILAVKRSADIQ